MSREKSIAGNHNLELEDLVRIQVELSRISRIYELAAMSGGLAHEINQPLTAATNFSQASQRLLMPLSDTLPEKIQQFLRKSVDQIERAINTIQDIRNQVPAAEVMVVPENLNDLVRTAIDLFALQTDRNPPRVIFCGDPTVPQACVDRYSLFFILIHLLRNAAEATQELNHPEINIATILGKEGQVEVTVSDNGPGLSEEVSGRIFQPFLSSKSSGMGLGLISSLRAAERMGGDLWYDDRPGGGIVFHLSLPTVEPE